MKISFESYFPASGESPNRALSTPPNLRRILDEKDDVQYGARIRTQDDAKALLGRLEEFATWAEAELARPH